HQGVELRPPLRVEADDLAVEHDGMPLESLGQLAAQAIESAEPEALPRDKAGAVRVHESERAEAVELQLEEPVAVVERVGPTKERHRDDGGKAHARGRYRPGSRAATRRLSAAPRASRDSRRRSRTSTVRRTASWARCGEAYSDARRSRGAFLALPHGLHM